MTALGWLAGETIVQYVKEFDHWIAFGLLLFVGGQMIRSGMSSDRRQQTSDPSRRWSLVILSVATSIDALAVGLSLGMLQADIWRTVAMIGIVTMIISLLTFWLGARLSTVFGKRMEIAGGLVLWLVGVRILVEHLR